MRAQAAPEKTESFSRVPHAATLPHGFMVAGVSSGCGKTTITLALLAALTRCGRAPDGGLVLPALAHERTVVAAASDQRPLVVQSFKVGPDYIDPALHSLITALPSWNLDGWMCGRAAVHRTVAMAMTTIVPSRDVSTRTVPAFSPCTACSVPAAGLPEAPLIRADVAVVEGVMGLFDGASGLDDSGSSAEVAGWLSLPVVLVVDGRGMARSVAALVAGYVGFRADLRFAGVICTRVSSSGHQSMIREALLQNCPHIPLLGCLPVATCATRPSRHLGLITAQDSPVPPAQQDELAQWCMKHVDMHRLWARSACPHLLDEFAAHGGDQGGGEIQPVAPGVPRSSVAGAVPAALGATGALGIPVSPLHRKPRIAVAQDVAFCFIYPALIQALSRAGAELIFFSPLADARLPACTGVWLPGGYPELHVERLADNVSMASSLRELVAAGVPVHGECGGYIWLMESLEVHGVTHAMSGCLPLHARLGQRRAALGYRSMATSRASAFGPAGTVLRGHEFHYSSLLELRTAPADALWTLRNRQHRLLGPEGCQHEMLSASWVHLHPDANPEAVRAFVAACTPL